MSMKAIIDNQVVPLTPEILAAVFNGLDNEGQARFFNVVGALAKQWIEEGGGTLEYQMLNVGACEGLNDEGREAMRAIGGGL